MWKLIIGVIVFMLIIILFVRFTRVKCPKCKSGKMHEIGRKKIKSEPKLFKETVKSKVYDNKNNASTSFGQIASTNSYYNPPSKIVTNEVIVEGKRTWYDVRYKCDECGHEFTFETFEDTKPKIE